MLDLLPPEIFARVLEIATETWGVGFLPTICLVSSTCRGVAVSTPSLWGIIVADKNSSVQLLQQQLVKAKAADLKVTFSRKGLRMSDKGTRRFITNVVALAHNWVRAEMPTNIISSTRWADLRRVEALSLRFHGFEDQADEFFAESEYTQSNLHSFAASSLPEEWTTRFLGPRITYLEIARLDRVPTSTIQRYLSLVPNVHTLNLPHISLLPLSASTEMVSLPHLQNLDLLHVGELASLLLNVRAPALRTLSIRECTAAGEMGPVFSQWSQPGFLPASLQSVELSNCLSEQALPFLIGWLSRLPALLRLTISDEALDAYSFADPDESQLVNSIAGALAAPDGAGPIVGGWLCPSLIHLCLDLPLRLADILPIARARSGAASTPSRLRSMQAPLCASGTPEEIAEFRSYFAEPEDARCLCIACSFNLSI
ncbi:hypothetical protein C8R46DRAFT_279570 [Mycena filopes]|nr:hypothetical protein C8R46DRAFT_279570 [Mycena filopes]